MNVNEFIDKLRRYVGSESQIEYFHAEQFINQLTLPPPIITVNVMNKLFPGWNEDNKISEVEMIFKYQINFGGVYVSMYVKVWNSTEEDYEDIEIDLIDKNEELYCEITIRMEKMLDGTESFVAEMFTDMFSQEILDLFDRRGIILSSVIEEGYDT